MSSADRAAVAGRRRRRLAAAWSLLALALAAARVQPAAPQAASPAAWDPAVEKRWAERPPSLGIENAYRDTLAAWARGVPGAAGRYAAFQVEVVEGILGKEVTASHLLTERTQLAFGCLAATQSSTQRLLRALDPEVLPAIYLFGLEVYLEDLARPRHFWLAARDWERLDALRRALRGRAAAPPRGEDVLLARLLIETGARLEELGLIDQLVRARQAYERAVEHAPGSVAARYRAAFLAEKLGLYRRALRQLDWLAERRPADREALLRRALVAGRLGRPGASADELRELTRGGEAWVRAIAFQELARVLAAEDPGAAVALLRRAIAELPGEHQLQTLLAFHLGPVSGEGRRLLERLGAGTAAGPQPSPRALYEKGREGELPAERLLLAAEIDRRRQRLVAAIAELERDEMPRDAARGRRARRPGRELISECRGYRAPGAGRWR